MKKAFSVVIAAIVGLALLAGLATPAVAQQQKGGRDPQAEMLIYKRLDAINPRAVPPFKIGTEAMDAGDLQVARDNFKSVLYLAPELRRAAPGKLAQGRTARPPGIAGRPLPCQPDRPGAGSDRCQR